MPAPDEDELDRLIGLLYDAGQEEVAWSEVVEAIRVAFGGMSAIIHRVDAAAGIYAVIGRTQLSDDVMAPYAAHWFALDPWTREGARRPVGQASIGSELVALDQLRRTSFHAEYLRPVLGAEDVIGGIGAAGGTMVTPIGIHRAAGLPAYDLADRAAMQRLLPHLARAVGLSERLRILRAERSDLAAALDALPGAVALVTSQGRVVLANRAARALHARGLGLVVDARLGAARSADDARLRGLFARVGQSGRAEAMALPRPDGRSFQILAAPLPRQRAHAGMAALVVLVADPDDRPTPPAARLGALFGLTSAEAAVALALAAGERTEEIASRRGVTMPTLRTQIRAILAKTGAVRQSDLTRLLAMLPRLHGEER